MCFCTIALLGEGEGFMILLLLEGGGEKKNWMFHLVFFVGSLVFLFCSVYLVNSMI